jgi:hypothetical protein
VERDLAVEGQEGQLPGRTSSFLNAIDVTAAEALAMAAVCRYGS